MAKMKIEKSDDQEVRELIREYWEMVESDSESEPVDAAPKRPRHRKAK